MPPAKLNLTQIRADFPLLADAMQGQPLVYLDNAATTQKPQAVLAALQNYYTHQNANVHRGVFELSARATEAYEAARDIVQKFIHARSRKEIIFTRGTTEAINLVAATFGRQQVGKGDTILISDLEHHSNIVPWQLLAEQVGAKLKSVPLTAEAGFDLAAYKKLLTPEVKLVAVTHVSNALGVITPIQKIITLAHAKKIPVLVDGAQAVPHIPVDVQKLGADFYCFSGHKAYGPTGIGILYAQREHLEAMPPYQGGGDMIKSVTLEKTTYSDLPYKFEAGTPNIAGAIGLGAALGYLTKLGLPAIAAHEHDLLEYATEKLSAIPNLKIHGTTKAKTAVVSFTITGIHPHDLGTVLDRSGIAIRTGHHCAQPLMAALGVPATARASFALYNTRAEVDALVSAILQAITLLT